MNRNFRQTLKAAIFSLMPLLSSQACRQDNIQMPNNSVVRIIEPQNNDSVFTGRSYPAVADATNPFQETRLEFYQGNTLLGQNSLSTNPSITTQYAPLVGSNSFKAVAIAEDGTRDSALASVTGFSIPIPGTNVVIQIAPNPVAMGDSSLGLQQAIACPAPTGTAAATRYILAGGARADTSVTPITRQTRNHVGNTPFSCIYTVLGENFTATDTAHVNPLLNNSVVRISEPQNGASVFVGRSYPAVANATNSTQQARLEFYQGNTLLGQNSLSTNPSVTTQYAPLVGSNSFKAVAIAEDGTRDSALASVTGFSIPIPGTNVVIQIAPNPVAIGDSSLGLAQTIACPAPIGSAPATRYVLAGGSLGRIVADTSATPISRPTRNPVGNTPYSCTYTMLGENFTAIDTAHVTPTIPPTTNTLRFIQPDMTLRYTSLDNILVNLTRAGQGPSTIQYLLDAQVNRTQTGTDTFSLIYTQPPLSVGNHQLKGYLVQNNAVVDSAAALALRIRQEPAPTCTATLNRPFVGQPYTVSAGAQDPDTAGVDSYRLRRNDGQFTQNGTTPLSLTRTDTLPAAHIYFCDITRNGRMQSASVPVTVVAPQAPTKTPQVRDWFYGQPASIADTVTTDPNNPVTILSTLNGTAVPVNGNIIRQNPLMTQRGVNTRLTVVTPQYGLPVTFTDTIMARYSPAPQCTAPATAPANSSVTVTCRASDPDNALPFNSPATYRFYAGNNIMPYDSVTGIRAAATQFTKQFPVQGTGTYNLRVDLIVPLPVPLRNTVTGGILQTENVVLQRITVNVP